ncbi:MAG: hypothetical protein NTY65_08255 [Planctomycetota bacterium]|nr:hypothetical protein [Planctomycetota bacterium]
MKRTAINLSTPVWTQASLAREMKWSRAGHVEQGGFDVAAPVIG